MNIVYTFPSGVHWSGALSAHCPRLTHGMKFMNELPIDERRMATSLFLGQCVLGEPDCILVVKLNALPACESNVLTNVLRMG